MALPVAEVMLFVQLLKTCSVDLVQTRFSDRIRRDLSNGSKMVLLSSEGTEKSAPFRGERLLFDLVGFWCQLHVCLIL